MQQANHPPSKQRPHLNEAVVVNEGKDGHDKLAVKAIRDPAMPGDEIIKVLQPSWSAIVAGCLHADIKRREAQQVLFTP